VGVLGAFFWGISVGQRLCRGETFGAFGKRVKGEVWQAPDPEEKSPAAYQAGGASAMDPLAFLDEHINRNLKQMHSPRAGKTLLDPELAGRAPSQAGRGGE
jgi:hypothetical protein